MIKHVVMWKIKKAEEKDETVREIEKRLMKLPAIIPQIKSYEVGVNCIESPAAADVMLISTFHSMEDLDTYREHPEHVAVASYIASVVGDRMAADYTC